MKILQILPEMNVGGVERGTLDLAKYIAAHGHGSVVVSNGGTLVPLLEAQGTRHYTLPVHRKNLWTIWESVSALEKIIREEKVDIVHARSRVPAVIAYFACRRTGVDFLTTCHGYYSRNLFSHVMGWGKLVIVISEIVGRHMIEHFGVQPENVRLIHRSVDLDKFKFRERQTGRSEFIVTIVGRINPIKGHTYFLKAMAKVMRQQPFVRARIIGDAPANKQAYKESLLLLVRRLGIQDKVEFLGNRSDIPQLLADSDALVLSTVTQEAFGRVIIEAQAVGVPVIAAKVGGVVDIVEHEKTGLLVLPKDPDAIASAVLRLVSDRKLGDVMCAEARRRVEQRFTVEQMALKTIAVYDELKHCQNILVIKLSAVGDVILATASFKALRETFPRARICCLTSRESAVILHNCPYLDDVVVYDHQGKGRGLKGFWKLIVRLRKYRFDKIIDLQNNLRTHLLAFLCMPQASYGYRNKKLGKLLSHGIADSDPLMPPVQHQFNVLKELGVQYHDSVRLELWPRADDVAYARELLQGEWIDEKCHKIVGINIAASERWVTKNWPVKAIAELCDLLAADNIRVIITGMEKDQRFAREVLAQARSKPGIVAGKTTILQLAALIGFCHVYVSSDSAPLHIAAAMKVPVVALFGPTDPVRHIPPADRLTVVRKAIECTACYSTKCRKGTLACMKGITAAEIYGEIKKFLL
ncbi:MAG: glycosyltransferase [Candidatus Omnitrophica bacterium]|nr:glycosyltransferase [Candidatus Omnitrophota bacterium]